VRLYTSTITGFLIFRAKLSNHAENSLNAMQLKLFKKTGRAGVAARPSWWKKIFQVCQSNISEYNCLPTYKNARYKNTPDLQVTA
jgi:hypothetical protein